MNERAYKKSIIHGAIDENGPVNLARLSFITGYSTREIKKVVQDLRHDGISVCSTTDNGYWLSKNIQDIDITIKQIKSRIETSLNTVRDLENIKETLLNECE